MKVRWWDKVAIRQARHVITVALTIGIALTCFQIYYDYSKEKSLLTSTILQVINTTKNAAAESAYNIDIQLANEVANGLFEFEPILEIKIVDELGTLLADRKRELGDHNFRWLADKLFGEKSEYSVKLYHNEKPNFSVGTLNVRVDPRETAVAFFDRSLIAFGSGIFRNLILALILTIVFIRFLAKPLVEISEAFAKFDPKMPAQTVLPVLKNHEKDEFRVLTNAGNRMLEAINSELGNRARVEEELRQENEERQKIEGKLRLAHEELEQRVEERTQDLRREIAERKFVEATLRQSQERFRDIAESTSDWFWEMGPDLCFTYVSRKGYDSIGLTPGDVIGKSRFELLSQDELGENSEKWRLHKEDLENRLPFQKLEYSVELKGEGMHHYQVSGKPFFDEAGEFLGYRGAARDITQRIQREKDLSVAKEEADLANQAKSEFLSSMSHELRTPLNGVLGFAQLLEYSPDEPLSERQTEYVDHILKAGDHLLELINEVLDLAKIESGSISLSIEPIEPSIVIQECIELLSPLAEKHEVHIIGDDSGDSEDALVLADFTRLKQILVNLMSNAIKYNRKGGQVTLACHRHREFFRFLITDTGYGIPEDRIEALFLPFNRLEAENSEIEGTGVGLTITKRLVELMGGGISLESTVGKGSTFWIDLPVLSEEETFTQVRSETREKSYPLATEQTFGEKKMVLYVEDNPANLDLMRELMVQFSDVKMISAHTAELGLELAEAHRPDLILLDINLPGMNGFEALERLQEMEEIKDTPILALSANAMERDIERGLEAGFLDYLTKPLNIEKTLNAIRTALESKS
ncbi:MAG: ATP-binding protein [Alphaproteobacteria bacterium]|nr:ATP-binding protein [Rhodospirillales bacterium]MCW9046058.1 ATP-binding protein [Alphaproteobacteria bacterium]